jgi:hypothetical protein
MKRFHLWVKLLLIMLWGLSSLKLAAQGGTAGEGPIVTAYVASPPTIKAGETTTLFWRVENCARSELYAGATLVTRTDNGCAYYIGVSPQVTTPYVLKIFPSNGSGPTTQTVVVRVVDPNAPGPAIESFTSSAATVWEGEPIRLSWRVKNCVRVELKGEAGAALSVPNSCEGAVDLVPVKNTIYTLNAYSENEKLSSATVAVQVNIRVIQPVIDFFYAQNQNINEGEGADLYFKAHDAIKLELKDPNYGMYPLQTFEGGIRVFPLVTSDYVLYAYNAQGQFVTSAVRINVTPKPPRIESFVASSDNIEQGESVTLSWNAPGATKVTISSDPQSFYRDNLPASGNLVVNPNQGTSYLITATNAVGATVTGRLFVAVRPAVPYPTIEYFNANTAAVYEGDSVYLSWSVRDSIRVELVSEPGSVYYNSVSPVSSVTVTPNVTSNYVLNAFDAKGRVVTARLTVQVNPGPRYPIIETFWAAANVIEEGQQTVLQWQVRDCDHVYVSGPSVAGGAALMGCNSTIIVAPQYSAQFTLTAYGQNNGGTDSRTLWLEVRPRYNPPPYYPPPYNPGYPPPPPIYNPGPRPPYHPGGYQPPPPPVYRPEPRPPRHPGGGVHPPQPPRHPGGGVHPPQPPRRPGEPPRPPRRPR